MVTTPHTYFCRSKSEGVRLVWNVYVRSPSPSYSFSASTIATLCMPVDTGKKAPGESAGGELTHCCKKKWCNSCVCVCVCVCGFTFMAVFVSKTDIQPYRCDGNLIHTHDIHLYTSAHRRWFGSGAEYSLRPNGS